ncbi:TSUP family transporter, partial [Tardiphaga sp.]|uniref:TSUP family transporter n=1 Tax=Tardiphaga sp. TaxID=1926292 RepID=UPI0037DA027C
MITMMQGVLGLGSGALVGFSLGLVGGGGSILAVPLMVYVVGVNNPHVAIGTSAIAVAANAAINLGNHARGGNVHWSCALVFATAGILGALGGSILGKQMDGQNLLAMFAILMLVIAVLMLKTRARIGAHRVAISSANTPALLGLGLVTGTLSGFFGIGGGFLIVPALML